MTVKWTAEQQRVIDTRDKDILVSAAAGSGKTAVLVARILSIITDEKKPVDIDRLLVVTFTNAAASEMRGRIRDALEERARLDPDNVHLQRQLVLVHNAKITTIHSFCLHVLRNHFQTIGIDPAFRIADEGEVRLLEQEVAEQVVNEAYENRDEAFMEFLERFATGKSDAEVESIILQIYHFALGQPFPEKFLQECREAYERDWEEERSDTGSISSGAWLDYIETDTSLRLADIRGQLMHALAVSREPDGPYPYEKALISDLDLVEHLEACSSYREYLNAFRNMGAFARLGSRKDETISEEKKQQVQAIRSDCKEQITDLRDRYYYDGYDVLQDEFKNSGIVIRVLTGLTGVFMKELSEKKAEKNILDFGDMEHLALRALVSDDPEHTPTPVASEYAETFEEVMIDEYQDSNLVQELILGSVSGKGTGARNRFMVGDVKQSIYRFRLARPELFMEKYHRYAVEDEGEAACRIDLHRNFRSRRQVLDFVNFVFRRIMTEPLGGIAYDEDAALYPGAVFPEAELETKRTAFEAADSGTPRETETWYTAELLILDGAGHSDDDSTERMDSRTMSEQGEYSASDLRAEEARMVGRRIRELVGTMPVLDKESGSFRPAQYGDIVILLRTLSGWAETFGEVLSDMGIPCFTGSQTGYFSAAEVRLVLSYLQILDNPLQDIPLAAVLRSAIGKLNDEELARIRLAGKEDPKLSFYDCCRLYLKQFPDTQTGKKLCSFFRVWESLRAKCGHTPVHQLLWELLDVTGYGEYASALPAGQQRKANLDMLVEKAIAYEATSYRGLYHFVRYIENLQKYEVDYGEANLGSEADNTVRILSIHKSKGLEFPIVFVSGMGKQFNESDARGKIAMHPEWGMACDCILHPYTEENSREEELPRMRQPTLLKKVIQQKLSSENLGEELRVLYVAMTRAKEKLILTGGVKNLEKKISDSFLKETDADQTKTGQIGYSRLSGASSYLDWVLPAIQCGPGIRQTDRGENNFGDKMAMNLSEDGERLFQIQVYTPEKNAEEETSGQKNDWILLQELLQTSPDVCVDEQTRDYLKGVFETSYPYEGNRSIPGKLTVSELKKMSQRMEETDAQELYSPETVVPLIPRFAANMEPACTESEVQTILTETDAARAAFGGAERGTLYHTFMENLDFSKEEDLRFQLEELIRCGKMSENDAARISLRDISVFLHSRTGSRMKAAASRGSLFREQPFVLGVPADEVFSGQEDGKNSSQEIILVQGIIDAWFVEDGQITVVDYKTDRVSEGAVLAARYHTQMKYYAKALERLTGRKVGDRIIYSFFLREEVEL